MHRKLMLVCMAAASFAAFMIVPAAQGAVLTENGTALAVGSSFTATNTGTIKFTTGSAFECEVGHLQGTVTTNSAGTVEGQIPVGGATLTNVGGAACSTPLGATTYTFTSKLCLRVAKGSDTLTITGCGGNVVYDMVAAGVNCRYEAASISGSITTNTTPATLTVAEQTVKEVGGLFFCPDEVKLDMAFDFYTTGGTTGLTFS